MQSGVVYGEAARIDGLLDMVLAELENDGNEDASPVPIVLTGGFAHDLAALLRHDVQVDETLTLRGLNLLWRANER